MPLLDHTMVGVGLPVVEQFSDTSCPEMAFTSDGEITAVGGTVGVVLVQGQD